MRWHVRVTWWLLRALGVLPLRVLYAIGTAWGRFLWWRPRGRSRLNWRMMCRFCNSTCRRGIIFPGRYRW